MLGPPDVAVLPFQAMKREAYRLDLRARIAVALEFSGDPLSAAGLT